MEAPEEREPGECSRSPSPDDVAIVSDVRSSTARTPREEPSKFRKNDSLVELVDLEVEEEDDDIEVLTDEQLNQDDAVDDFFVLDTSGIEAVEKEETEEVEEIRIISPAPVQCLQAEGRTDSQRALKTRRKEETFDLTKILTNDAAIASPSQEKKERFKMNCFNCGGEHTMQQCDIPLNQRRIATNRAAHYNSKNKPSSQERYTAAVDDEADGTAVVPGRISDSLREALGIGRYDIPEWIYRMRDKGFIDGYPPGYLAEALEGCAGKESLLEFHTDDKSLETPKSAQENDEEILQMPVVSAEKIVVYPGFNYYDRRLNDEEQFRVPRFNEYVQYIQEFAKEMFLQEQLRDVDLKRARKRKTEIEGCSTDFKQSRSDVEDDVVLIDDDDDDNADEGEIISSQSSEEVVNESDIERSVTPTHSQSTVSSSPGTPSSLSQGSGGKVLFGTPVACRKEHDKKKPSLDKFRADIVPFEAREECAENRGFFKTLMKIIRKKD